ncbi:MAG: TIGR04295 family B12-binding domain-containing radical SAM protein [Chloroflexota bacterium]
MYKNYRRIALVNPPWEFEGSRYWACREPHLPLELLYADALLRKRGLDTLLVDAHLEKLSPRLLEERIGAFGPDMIVITTAPSYLFWRCPPPELDIPALACKALGSVAPIVAVGPHGSATPGYVMDRLNCQAIIRGEPEEELVRLALGDPTAATIWATDRDRICDSKVAAVDLKALPSLDYRAYPLEKKAHRHHLFWGEGLGAEVEFSRGCPYRCSFCNRRFFRLRYRQRPLNTVLKELRELKARGVDYVYFIDELFGLGVTDSLLETLSREPLVHFGCETRLDLWDEARLDLLAAAGCVSLEFGLESPFREEQDKLNKDYHLQPDRILELMVHAKGKIPWVQADLVEIPGSGPDLIRRTEEWRQEAIRQGVWISEPVKLFPYPGSKLHEQLFGPITDKAWLEAMERY